MVYQFTNLQADSGDAMINLYQWEHPMGKFLLQKLLSKKNEHQNSRSIYKQGQTENIAYGEQVILLGKENIAYGEQVIL